MTAKHCTEHQLDLLLRMPDKLSREEHKAIDSHVSQCKLCEEHLQTLREFYADLEERLQQPATDRDRAFSEALLFRKSTRLLPFRGVVKKPSQTLLEKIKLDIEPYRRPLPQRIWRFVQVHPVRVAGATSLASLALAAVFLVVGPSRDVNPSHARIKDYVLSVYNKDGDVLWTKSALGIPDRTSESMAEGYRRRLISVLDIDGNSSNEVLLSGATAQSSPAQDTLYCFNGDGRLRWKHGVGQAIAFGEMDFTPHSRWAIIDFFTIENADTKKPRLFVSAKAEPYFPSKVFELDPKDGRERQSYWHPGNFDHVLILDIDLDGKDEIILGGVNNAYRRACIAVLDPAHINGYGPATPKFTPGNLSKGREKYYLLLPLTKLGQTIGANSYNFVQNLTLNNDGSFIAHTTEVPGEPPELAGGILYTIAPKVKVMAAIGSDPFLKSHARLIKQEKLQEQLGPAYWEKLINSVRYWDGERFVNQPTGNALYFGAQNVR